MKDVEEKETATSNSNLSHRVKKVLKQMKNYCSLLDVNQNLILTKLLNLKKKKSKLRNENSGLKKQLENFMYTKDKFRKNEELVTIYIGLADFNVLGNSLFNLVKLDIAMKKGKLTPFEMFILCLMRLHVGMAVVDLANRSQICKTTVSNFFVTVRCPLCKIVTNYYLASRFRINSLYANVFRAKFGTKITTE